MAARSEFLTETWYYSREQIENTPSRKYGVDQDKELSYRQQAANLIQDMGQRLTVNQLCINTGIVYMHRFYMVHSFTKFHRNVIAPACLFLGAKVEEQPRKLEHVVRVAYACLNRETQQQLNPKTELYSQLAQELVINESIILQTLGFEIAVDHPHTHVVKCTQLIRASKDLSQTSYFMATNSLHLTTFCLRYKPTAVACACIHLSAKWSKMQIPKSSDGKNFWEYVDRNMTLPVLDDITREFIQIIESSPNRLKRKLTLKAQQATDTDSKYRVNENASTSSSSTSIFDEDPSSYSKIDIPQLNFKDQTDGDKIIAPTVPSKSSINLNEYKMMKEKETKREREKARQRESQKIDEQKHTNHNRLLEQGKQKDVSSRSDHPAKHTESRSYDGQVKPKEGHSSSNRSDQVKHGDHKWSSLHSETPEKLSDTSSHGSQGHGDAHRTHDRSRAQPHAPTHGDRTQSSVKPSSKDVRPADHKKDVRHRHHHPEKRPNDHHKRPVEESRTTDQRHRTEQRPPEGSGKVALPKYRHLQENPADLKILESEQKETMSMMEKTNQDYILMKPDSLVEMDILGALQEECASPHIPNLHTASPHIPSPLIPSPHIPSPRIPSPHIPSPHKTNPAPMSQLDYKSGLSKGVKDRFKRDMNAERVPDHLSLLQESMQGISKKEPVSQPIVSKDRRKKAGEQSHEVKMSKVKPEQVRVKPEQGRVKPEQVKVKPEQVKVKPEQIKVKPEQVRVKPEQVRVKPAQVRVQPEQVRVQPEQVRVQPEQVRVKPEQVRVKPEQVKVKPEQVKVKPEQVKVKPEQVKPKPESPRLKKESLKMPQDVVKSKSEHPASPVKGRKDVLHQDSPKPPKSELLSSPVKSRKNVLQSPSKMKKQRIATKPVMQEASTLDLSSIGIGNLLTTHEPIREQHREKHRTPDVLSPPKVKREHAAPVVKKETAVKLDFNYPKPVLQKVKSEPIMKPVAPPKKRIKNMMQTQSQPPDFDAQYLGVPQPTPQQVASQHIPKPAPQQMNPYHMQPTLKQKPQTAVRQVQQPAQQQKPHPPVQQIPQPVHQQVPEPMATFSNPVVESWSDMMHPAEILDASDFLNDMKHDMSQLDDLSLSTGLLPDNLFDFQETESTNPVQMNVSSEVLAQQAMILPLTTIEPSPSAKKKSVHRVSSEVKHTEPMVIHKEVHPAEVLDEMDVTPVKKSKPVKRDVERLATNQLEFEPHPAELFETKSAPVQVLPKAKEPSEDGELAGDESLVHPTEIENPALLRVKNEEPVVQKDRSSDQERRSDHRHSEHKRHSKHKHSSEKKKKDKDRDRHRSKDRSSSRSREVHSSESRENSNGNGAGPSDEQPTSVLTTSGGIKLKIKLGNSFSEKQSSPSAGSSPLSMKIDLKKIQSSKRDYDSKHDKERRKDKSKSHKHKSHKRSHSPLESSTGDTPASPAKRRATNSSHNSLLSLPMPPADPKKKSKHSLNNSNGESPASNVYNFN